MKLRRKPFNLFGWILSVLLLLAVSACAAPASTSIPTLTAVHIEASPTAQPPLPTLAPQPAAPTATLPPLITPTVPASQAPLTDAAFRGPLSVIILSPADGAEVQTSTVILVGEADPETVLSIGDQILVTDAGRTFSIPVVLEEGPNIIEITASDVDGNQETGYLTLTYNP